MYRLYVRILNKMKLFLDMKKKILNLGLLGIFLIIIVSTLISAYEDDFTKVKQLIDSKISCDNLTNVQLESIGDYYMEQMHPGEAHEYMDRMMGGDSETTRQMHVSMAKSIYCNEDVGMGNMMNMMSDNMMGGQNNMMQGMMGNNMMYNYGIYNSGFVVIFWITYMLIIILFVSAIYWLIKSASRKK